MRATQTITISMPREMAKDIVKAAKEEQRTVSELIREVFRQYRAKRAYEKLATEVRAVVKKKGLTEKDFGGPFAK
jgi:metal-responsive CopG/Arc/MetJ family transcriptional regulator